MAWRIEAWGERRRHAQVRRVARHEQVGEDALGVKPESWYSEDMGLWAGVASGSAGIEDFMAASGS